MFTIDSGLEARTRLATHSNDQFAFGAGFLRDHVGQIMDNPEIAILELIANSYNAGASRVDVTWPLLPEVRSLRNRRRGNG